ncbi:MAG: ROK family protein [Spirochaetales bacterium]|nr:ROK family protein [Spirochaetales bacterium]
MSIDKLIFPKLSSNGTQANILKIVRDSSPISRSGIVAQSGLPHAAVSRSISDLLDNQIVIEEPLTDTKGPRRKRGIRLNPELGHCLSVKYGPAGIEGVIIDTSYETLFKKSEKVKLETASRDKKIEIIISFIKTLMESVSSLPGKCLGLAVIDPGIIDKQARVSLMTTIMDDWNNVPIVDILQGHFNLPVMLSNSSTALIRAVDRLELKNRYGNLIYIEYGKGISCGLKLEGNYILGASNFAGELGHLKVTASQIPCKCGGVGCLEAIAALSALAHNAKEAINRNTSSSLAEIDTIDGLAVLTAAAKNDRLSMRIVEEAFEYLGQAVAGLVNILNPEVLVFDNNINLAGKEAIETLMRSLHKNILPFSLTELKIKISTTPLYLCVLGGAVSVLDNCL